MTFANEDRPFALLRRCIGGSGDGLGLDGFVGRTVRVIPKSVLLCQLKLF
jgi:hypothetical protein